MPSTSLQQTLRNLDKALRQSFPKNKNSSRKGFPKFKKKRNFNGSFSLTMVNSKRNLKDNKFYVNKSLGIDVILHRDLPSDFASCQVKQEANKWFVVFTVKKEKQQKRQITKTTGIDLNSKLYVTTDSVFPIPKYLSENQRRITELQRQLSRKNKGSKNKLQCQLKLQRIHYRIQKKRYDFFHKLSKHLVNSYDLITIEDLDVKSIQKKYGKVVADNGFSMFRSFLEYKCELYGTTLVVADRYFPSSQKCSSCGGITKHRLDQRIYTCNHCGFVIDRDLNAAINLDILGQELTDIKPVDPSAHNMDSSMSVLMGIDQKQEAARSLVVQ
jgi:putative transposase